MRDVAQVAAGELEHLADSTAKGDFARGQREAFHLFDADMRRDGQRIGVGDQVDKDRAGSSHSLGECVVDVARSLYVNSIDSYRLGNRRVINWTVIGFKVWQTVDQHFQLHHAQ